MGLFSVSERIRKKPGDMWRRMERESEKEKGVRVSKN